MTTLNALILAGGRSRRMGQEKARLKIGPRGIEVREYLYRLLTALVGTCVFSINRQQARDPYYGDKTCVIDMLEDRGPMGGLWSAMKSFPGCSFLTVACDMPRVDAPLIRRLIAERGMEGVFFEVDSFIEPLCGIYEYEIYSRVNSALQRGDLGLQTILKQANIKRIELSSGESFLNVNTKKDLNRFRGGNHGEKNVV